MNKIRLVAVVLFLCIGCANVGHTKIVFDADGKVISKEEFTYRRVGKQQIGSFSASVDKQGVMSVSLAQQKGDAGVLGGALKDVSAAVLKLAGP